MLGPIEFTNDSALSSSPVASSKPREVPIGAVLGADGGCGGEYTVFDILPDLREERLAPIRGW